MNYITKGDFSKISEIICKIMGWKLFEISIIFLGYGLINLWF